MLPARPRPRALIAALCFAVASVVAAITESVLLLATRNSMQEAAESMSDAALREEAMEFGVVIIVGVLGSMGIMLLIVASVMVAVLGKPAGRVLMFVASGISAGWNMWCGFIYSTPAIAGASQDDETMRHYTDWTHLLAVLSGFTAGIAAILAIIFLAQRSVGRYFRGEPPQLSARH